MYLPFLMERNEVRTMLEMSRKDFEEKSFKEVMEMAMDNCPICTEDDLRLYVIESVNDESYYLASHILDVLLAGYLTEFYDYDRAMGTLDTPEPIRTKEDLIEYGDIELID